MTTKPKDRYEELRQSLQSLPYISEPQVEQWLALQQTIDSTRDYLIRAVPEAQYSIAEAEKILDQRTYTLVFFGGTGVGKSTLINALLGRNLLPTGAVTAVTGTIVYIEQAEKDEPESLTLSFWNRDEFATGCAVSASSADGILRHHQPGGRTSARRHRRDHGRGRDNARRSATNTANPHRCIDTYEVHEDMFRTGRPRRRPCPWTTSNRCCICVKTASRATRTSGRSASCARPRSASTRAPGSRTC